MLIIWLNQKIECFNVGQYWWSMII